MKPKRRQPSVRPQMPERTKKRIKRMALLLRYAASVLIVGQGFLWAWLFRSMRAMSVSMGIGLICYGVYEIIGYCLRFRHVYCAMQNMYRQKMTPDHCEWERFPKTDWYGAPAVLIAWGVAVLLVSLLAG